MQIHMQLEKYRQHSHKSPIAVFILCQLWGWKPLFCREAVQQQHASQPRRMQGVWELQDTCSENTQKYTSGRVQWNIFTQCPWIFAEIVFWFDYHKESDKTSSSWCWSHPVRQHKCSIQLVLVHRVWSTSILKCLQSNSQKNTPGLDGGD